MDKRTRASTLFFLASAASLIAGVLQLAESDRSRGSAMVVLAALWFILGMREVRRRSSSKPDRQ